MIFHRLAVSHFKGIKSVEITFAPKGITLIEGPNEIGKSSLVHALTTLFEQSFKRNRNTLKHLIPNDDSGTPEILLEAQSSEYRFIYRKKYIDNKNAELIVLEPHPERFIDIQAQEQFERILNATLDRSLWKALMLQQGSAVGLPEVKDQQALMAALDSAVASSGVTPDTETLFDRIREEYSKYYHPNHAGELQRLRELRDAVKKAESEAEEAVNLLAGLNDKITLSRRKRGELNKLTNREANDRKMKDDFAKRLAEIEKLEKTLDAENAKLEISRQKRDSAEREIEVRKMLIDAEATARKSLTRICAEVETANAAEAEAARIARENESIWKQHDCNRKQSEKLAALRRADYDHLRNKLDLEQMRERKQRIDASTESVGMAKAELAGNKITEAAANLIREAAETVERARIRRDSAVPKLHINALAQCDLALDGSELHMAEGETRQWTVTDTVNLDIPGKLSITVTAGDGGSNLEAQLSEAVEQLRALLAKYGIDNPDDAPGLLEKRKEAERIIQEHKRVEKENLRDLQYSGAADGLVERILGLEETVAAYERTRSEIVPLPLTLDVAKVELDTAQNTLDAVTKSCESARAALESAKTERSNAREQVFQLQAEKNLKEREIATQSQSLAELRRTVSDETLNRTFADADSAYSDASRAVAVVATELEQHYPALVRQRLETLGKTLAETAGKKEETNNELSSLEVEINILGGTGLNERVAETEAAVERARLTLNAELRKAEAAKLLYEVVREARERSQKAYILPLKKEIEGLAKSVYATAVGIELTPDLRIASRVMNGQRVVFDNLSGGAREQFSLIHRAACSLAVSRDGGVPLILDDALGYSDGERLIGMNEVLSRAAQKCQIIILTCRPTRFGYLNPTVRINMQEALAKGLIMESCT